MDYDVNEMEASLDNMGDTLLEALQRNADNDNMKNCAAIYEEFIVDGRDPVDGKYEFLYIETLAILNHDQKDL